MAEETEGLDYDGIIAQLQKENEELRERLTHALKDTPISDTIDGIVMIVQKSDPMKLYIWACIAFLAVMALARLLEVFIK